MNLKKLYIKKNWEILNIIEKNYKAFLIVKRNNCDSMIKLELDIPDNIKKGCISNIKIACSENKDIALKFKEDFKND